METGASLAPGPAAPTESEPSMTETLLARLRLDLADAGHEPMATRLTDRIWEGVVDGEIAAGERLPTVRELAV
ncbi:MAG: hypothetical protein EA350_13370, partial [Gemmatimonadales bacterium]